MRHFIPLLMAASCLVPVAAHAANINAAGTATATATADVAAAAATDADAGDAIVVVGKGETRQTQQLSAKDIALLAPGTSPLKAIENLPSVNFQAADPFGAYEWAERISIRGFNQNQLGFTLDGVPLGDASYGNVNGLHISRAISSDNIGSTVVSQGAGALGTQATNNLGGTVEFNSLDPVDHFALDANGTYGSFNTWRAFGRLNVAAPDGGARAYIAVDHHDTEKWKGYGHQRQTLVNAKAIVPVGKAELSGYFSYSNRAEVDYQDMSLGMLGRLGYNWDNISNNWPLAVKVAQAYQNSTAFPAPFQTVDDAYYSGGGLRHDYLGWLGAKMPVTGNVTAEVKGYYHSNDGRGLWWTPYVPSPNGSPISLRTTEYSIRRGGIFGDVQAELGNNTLTVGGWWEHNAFHQARRYYSTNLTDPGQGLLDWPHNPFATQWEFAYQTETLQYYVEDTVHSGPLTVNAGWKGFQVVNKANPVVAGTLASGRIASTDWFQPHLGANYKVGPHGEIFASFSQSTRAFTAAATGSSPFATTQAGFNGVQNTLKPESSNTYELGYRYGDSWLNGTLSGYLVNFHNRLLSLTSGSGIQGNPTILQNVGSVRSLGIEALLNARLGHGFGATVSYSYNDSTYRDDVFDNAGTLIALTKGKTTVDSPKHLARAELNYDDKVFFGRVALNYMSKRYFTYTNDQFVGGRTLVDASIGYRWANSFTKKPIELQVNATNLFDVKYVSTVGTNGFGNSGDNQTLMLGAPRAVFGTVKVGF